MEELVQRIVNDLKINLPAFKDAEGAKKAVEEEVIALVCSGQVIEVRPLYYLKNG